MGSGAVAALVAVLTLGFEEGMRRFYPSKATWLRLRSKHGRRAVRAMRVRMEITADYRLTKALANTLLGLTIVWVAIASLLDKRWHEVVLDVLPYALVGFALIRTPSSLRVIAERMKEYERDLGEDPDRDYETGDGGPAADRAVSLADARLYLVAPARFRAGELADLIPELAAAGVDLIQLREKDLEAGEIIQLGEPIAVACREAGVPFIVNDRPDIALALSAEGVHLGQDDLPLEISRRVVDAFHGLSTHSAEQISRALELKPDYIAVGPVNATPTKPGRQGTGLELVRAASEQIEALPWFVTGGMAPETLPEVLEAGGRRIVVVRAIVEAADPPSVAGQLRKLLDEAPL